MSIRIKSILISITLMVFTVMFLSCVTSQEIIISYPENANWNFIYYDASGINLGDGKAIITVDKKDYTFTISLTESAFGDTAEFKGSLDPIDNQKDIITFKGVGKWFLGEDYYFEGAFNKDFTSILDGSVAYSVEIEEDVQDYLSTLRTYRVGLNTYNNLTQEEKQSTEEPVKPVSETFNGSLFTLEASSSN